MAKICKYCRSEIDDKASVCPHCQRKQSGIGDAFKAVIAAVAVIIFVPAFIGACSSFRKGYNDAKNTSVEVATTAEKKISVETGSTEADATTVTETESAAITEAETTTEDITHRSGDDIIGVSDKILSNDRVNVSCEDSIRNDNTGKWRLARISDSIYIENYALDYYKNYFKSDDEIHAVINFTTNTTAKISCFDGMLNVTTYKYIDKEEHDANLLFSGDKISEFFIYIDNGDIERIS